MCDMLLCIGFEIFIEKGFLVIGFDEIFGCVGVLKGLFYYYFDSKEVFGFELIDCYVEFFVCKFDCYFS